MAITFTYYLQTGDPVAHHLLPELVRAVIAKYPTTTAMPTGDGIGWVACNLSSDRDVAQETRTQYPGSLPDDATTPPVSLQISTRPDRLEQAIESGLAEGGPEALEQCDALAEVTVPGYLVDWTIVKTVHTAAIELWAAIGYTDQAGFELTEPAAD